MIFAAIDVGSNAIRLNVACVKNGKVKSIEKKRNSVRLGKDVFKDGVISEKKIASVAKVFKKYKEITSSYNVEFIRATATSAVRNSKNQKELLKAIKASSGIELEIIDPFIEGNLVFLAVNQELDLQDKNAIIMDIGGGSVELIAAVGGKVKDATSFKMGTLRAESSTENNNYAIKDFINSHYYKFAHFIFKNFEHIDLVAGTGGNVDCLGDLRVDFFKKRNSRHIHRHEVKILSKDMLNMSSESRAEHFDLEEDRADVILPAILTTRLLMRVCNVNTLEIPRVGLRDGIVLDLFNKHSKG